jgi:hypothetical protein
MAKIYAAVDKQNGGAARGYPAGFTSLAARS